MPKKLPQGGVRALWFILGWIMLALGVIGAFLPVMPTTVFLIMAAACFGKSSPKLEAKLLAHPTFGPSLRAWREERVIPKRAKLAACLGMAAGYLVFWLLAKPGWGLAALVGLPIAATAAWILSRPSTRLGRP